MFDTMTQTKIIAGLCGTWLVLLLGGWLAETIYHSDGHHGDDHHYAYVVEPEEEVADVPAEPEVPFADMMAAADMSAGAQLFQRQCSACHSAEAGGSGVGPYLHGVVGRDVGAVDGFGYSGSLVAVAQVWTVEDLNGFLEDPSGWAPGTAMGYGGMDEAEDRAHLITYLDSLDD